MTLQTGHPDRPGQLGNRPRDRLRCPGHSDRRLRADAAQYGGQRGRRQLARFRNAAIGLRSGDPRNADRHGSLDLRHRLHDQRSLGQQRSAVQQRRSGRLAQPDRHQVPDRLGERLGDVPDGPVEADGNRCDVGCRPQHQLVVSEQLVPGVAVGLHHQHPAHVDPALAGKCTAAGPGGRPAGGPRGQPRSDRDRPAQRRRRRLAVQGRGHGSLPLGRAAILEPGPVARSALELRSGRQPGPGDP